MEEASRPTISPNKFLPVLVVLLILASFLIGALYTKVQFLEKGAQVAKTTPDTAGKVAAAADQPAQPQVPENNPVDVDVTGAPTLGDKKAKVAIVEYTDYQCPFCKKLFDDAYPQIKKEYIDTGKVQYFVRDFPLFQIHPQAQKAAEAANCALDQGKFWEMHDTLFQNQSSILPDDLKKYAVNLGLNSDKFNNCLDTSQFADKIKKEQSDGEKLGVRGTPASFVGVVNGNTVTQAVMVSGAVPFETFKTTIEDQLKK